MWANFHTHSRYCDGKGELTDYVHAAKNSGMVSLGFSSHAPIPFQTKWCMKNERFLEYSREIDALKTSVSGLEIYKGLEVDFVPGVTSPLDFQEKLDYTIGSVHFVDYFSNGTGWEIDGSHASFLEGLSKIFHNSIKDAIHRYFELTREMLATACPSVIGHLDKIKIQNIDGKFFSETDTWYQEEIRQTIEAIQSTDVIVEVNTRGMYQKKSDTPYPSPWILSELHQRGIPITLSSDAHHCDDLVNQFPQTAGLLREIGFDTITILHQGEWKPYPFNDHGIIR